jgi:hypothetical protein
MNKEKYEIVEKSKIFQHSQNYALLGFSINFLGDKK